MEALILAGGLGTRLSSVLPHLPKALAPVRNVPFLQILFHQLARWKGLTRIVLALGHKATSIQDSIQSIQSPVPIAFSIETSPLGTGGAILHALQHLKGETFLAMNGDSFFDIDFAAFHQFHRAKQGVLSIACLEVGDSSRYGSIALDKTSKVNKFIEKATSPLHLGRGIINGGIYLMQKNSLKCFPVSCSLEKEIFPSLLSLGVYGYLSPGTFIDIGTPASLEQAQFIKFLSLN